MQCYTKGPPVKLVGNMSCTPRQAMQKKEKKRKKTLHEYYCQVMIGPMKGM